METTTKNTTNEKALKNGLKAVEELGIVAPALLRERLLTLCKFGLNHVQNNPKDYNSLFTNHKQIETVLSTFIKEIEF